MFHIVNDMERIGDHAENIIEMTQQMIADDLELSKRVLMTSRRWRKNH